MTSDPTPGLVPATALLTIAEAAALTGLSTDTIKNDRSAGRYPGARQDPPQGGKPGTWRIPGADLVAVGRLSPARLEQLPTEIDALRESSTVSALRGEVAEVTIRLAVAVAVAVAVAEAVAHERDHTRRALERSINILESTLGLLRRTFPGRAA